MLAALAAAALVFVLAVCADAYRWLMLLAHRFNAAAALLIVLLSGRSGRP
jgi:hypothetical protein